MNKRNETAAKNYSYNHIEEYKKAEAEAEIAATITGSYNQN